MGLNYCATLGRLKLEVLESNGRFAWNVTDSETGKQTAGEVAGLEDAMVAAAQAARAEWGVVRWRRIGVEETEEE